ncbi:hypothetical protein J6590_084890 [Homalodisca vitripennis]|nr:hypothetical protein J6590_084890 [Homalodisca vitripennis]
MGSGSFSGIGLGGMRTYRYSEVLYVSCNSLCGDITVCDETNRRSRTFQTGVEATKKITLKSPEEIFITGLHRPPNV